MTPGGLMPRGQLTRGGGGVVDPPQGGGGGQEQGTSVDPHPHPSGGGAQGAEAATSAAQVELDQPSPQGLCRGNRGSFSPPHPLPPTEKGTAGGGGNKRGSHGALCRPCVMSPSMQVMQGAQGGAALL